MNYNVGDIVRTKKQHPCGSKLWEITRVGVDFKLKCLNCRTYNNGRKTKSSKNDNKKGRTIEKMVIDTIYDFCKVPQQKLNA